MDRTAIGLTVLGLLALGQASCTGSREIAPDRVAVSRDAPREPAPQIIATSHPLQCVPYARMVSSIAIRGDAWTWWKSAARRYRRDRRPAAGSVLVLERSKRLRFGHLAVVSRVVNDREILVEHANWLNKGRIHRNLPVRDVSRDNDWSVVRVWYVPGNRLGTRRYPAHGFIHPNAARVSWRREPQKPETPTTPRRKG